MHGISIHIAFDTLTGKVDEKMAGTIEAKLNDLGIALPDAPAPAANYVPYTMAGNILTISGQISKAGDGSLLQGRLGDDVDVAHGQEAARICALNILSQAKAALGDLDRITQVVKIQGFVWASHYFKDHPQVINGASDFLVEVLGEKGRHARAAVGMSSLPLGVSVEIDAVIEFS